MTAATPTFEDFQKFSKDQLEAFTAASTTWSKGLQDIAAEFDRLFEEVLRRRDRDVREASRRAQRRDRRSRFRPNSRSRPMRALSPRRRRFPSSTPGSLPTL